MECLHVKTGTLIPSDDALLFEAAGANNKGHVYNFCSQSGVITIEHHVGNNLSSIPSVSSAVAHDCYIESERRLMEYIQ